MGTNVNCFRRSPAVMPPTARVSSGSWREIRREIRIPNRSRRHNLEITGWPRLGVAAEPSRCATGYGDRYGGKG